MKAPYQGPYYGPGGEGVLGPSEPEIPPFIQPPVEPTEPTYQDALDESFTAQIAGIQAQTGMAAVLAEEPVTIPPPVTVATIPAAQEVVTKDYAEPTAVTYEPYAGAGAFTALDVSGQANVWQPGTAIPAGYSLHTEGGVIYTIPSGTIEQALQTGQPIVASNDYYDWTCNCWHS